MHLLLAPRPVQRSLVHLMIVRLALAGPLLVLDGGNRFDGHYLAREVRRRTSELEGTLKRIELARAFTCYQMTALLGEASREAAPVVVLDLLATFYDENVRLSERQRLLQICLGQLRRLCRRAPVLVSAGQTAAGQDETLLEMLEGASEQVWHFELPEPRLQPRLFE